MSVLLILTLNCSPSASFVAGICSLLSCGRYTEADNVGSESKTASTSSADSHVRSTFSEKWSKSDLYPNDSSDEDDFPIKIGELKILGQLGSTMKSNGKEQLQFELGRLVAGFLSDITDIGLSDFHSPDLQQGRGIQEFFEMLSESVIVLKNLPKSNPNDTSLSSKLIMLGLIHVAKRAKSSSDHSGEELVKVDKLVSGTNDPKIPETALPLIRRLFALERDCPTDRTESECVIDQIRSVE
jgi:hypothetical protein